MSGLSNGIEMQSNSLTNNLYATDFQNPSSITFICENFVRKGGFTKFYNNGSLMLTIDKRLEEKNHSTAEDIMLKVTEKHNNQCLEAQRVGFFVI